MLQEQNEELHPIILSQKIQKVQNKPQYFHINEKVSVDNDVGDHR